MSQGITLPPFPMSQGITLAPFSARLRGPGARLCWPGIFLVPQPRGRPTRDRGVRSNGACLLRQCKRIGRCLVANPPPRLQGQTPPHPRVANDELTLWLAVGSVYTLSYIICGGFSKCERRTHRPGAVHGRSRARDLPLEHLAAGQLHLQGVGEARRAPQRPQFVLRTLLAPSINPGSLCCCGESALRVAC